MGDAEWAALAVRTLIDRCVRQLVAQLELQTAQWLRASKR